MRETFKIYDEGAINHQDISTATLGACSGYVLVRFEPEGLGYRYLITDAGLPIASGWAKIKDERALRRALQHLVLQMGLECGRGEESENQP